MPSPLANAPLCAIFHLLHPSQTVNAAAVATEDWVKLAKEMDSKSPLEIMDHVRSPLFAPFSVFLSRSHFLGPPPDGAAQQRSPLLSFTPLALRVFFRP